MFVHCISIVRSAAKTATGAVTRDVTPQGFYRICGR